MMAGKKAFMDLAATGMIGGTCVGGVYLLLPSFMPIARAHSGTPCPDGAGSGGWTRQMDGLECGAYVAP